jgi:hypothetical protein
VMLERFRTSSWVLYPGSIGSSLRIVKKSLMRRQFYIEHLGLEMKNSPCICGSKETNGKSILRLACGFL